MPAGFSTKVSTNGILPPPWGENCILFRITIPALPKGVLRGLHYQIHQPQGKLVRVVAGEVLDVAVDLRRSSASFGHSVSTILSAENQKQLWIPEGFAHGFLVLSDSADFLYKTTDFWAAEHERCLRWDDPALGIGWPEKLQPILSAKDAAAPLLQNVECFA